MQSKNRSMQDMAPMEIRKLAKDRRKQARIYLTKNAIVMFQESPYLFEGKYLFARTLDTQSDPGFLCAELFCKRKEGRQADHVELVLVPVGSAAWIEVERPFRAVQSPGFGKSD